MRRGKRIRVWQLVAIGLVSACVSLVANVSFAKMSKEGIVTNQGNLQVAKWDVSVEDAGDGVDLVAGGSPQVYTLTVKNNSDVASDYILEISNIPEGVSVGLGDGDLQEPDADNKVVFEETGGVLDLEERTRQHSLKFSAVLEAGAIADSDMAEMTVSVQFKQKEPQ